MAMETGDRFMMTCYQAWLDVFTLIRTFICIEQLHCVSNVKKGSAYFALLLVREVIYGNVPTLRNHENW